MPASKSAKLAKAAKPSAKKQVKPVAPPAKAPLKVVKTSGAPVAKSGSKTATKAKPVPSSTKTAPVAKADKATAKDEPRKALKVVATEEPAKKKPGRPPKAAAAESGAPAKTAGAKRGRKPKAGGDKPEEDEDLSDIEAEFAEEPAAETATAATTE
jgi:RNA polymerase primary sigma factor